MKSLTIFFAILLLGVAIAIARNGKRGVTYLVREMGGVYHLRDRDGGDVHSYHTGCRGCRVWLLPVIWPEISSVCK